MEKTVDGPFAWTRSCSKYGSSRVAAGSAAVLRAGAASTVAAVAAIPSRQAATPSAALRVEDLFASVIPDAPFPV